MTVNLPLHPRLVLDVPQLLLLEPEIWKLPGCGGKETFPMDPEFREFREQSHGCSDHVTDQPACSVLNPRAVLPQAGEEDQGSVLKKFPCSSWIPDLSSLRTGPLGAGSSRKQWHAHQFTLIELPPEPGRRVRGRHGCLAPRNEISPDCLTDRK